MALFIATFTDRNLLLPTLSSQVHILSQNATSQVGGNLGEAEARIFYLLSHPVVLANCTARLSFMAAIVLVNLKLTTLNEIW